ncbi:uncharacterized protein F4812DRAFT_415353 [Daldinia caldariorum]|uniref:uncharacterized protein n=1 Tax=Daldinia caldariorum TaxID=326644 RepID=UPI002007677F|nr:uncharacterized protein F4812DRAFT_415353 [Daldinia caldariorum]KAI1471763.1 hypothetical protein F4812DRAFT_415353 [Daldinia caldariorum]
MTSLSTFQCFNNLPKELRILIWEYHFESARIHVIHPSPETHLRNPKRDVLLFHCTVLDSATNLIIPDGLPPSLLINHEAYNIAMSCKRQWTPVIFTNDLADSVSSGRARVHFQFSLTAGSNVPVEFNDTRPQARPVYVDWERDMLYLCVSNAEQAFWSMRTVRWRDRVRKLAVLVPQSEFDRAIPFGPTDPIREVLESMTELEELFVVLVPQVDGLVPVAATPSSNVLTGLSRDGFGFVPYVEYLKKVGLTSNHILYTRTAMSFREALADLPNKIRLKRVVDVDCLTCSFGYYRRSLSLCF